MTKQTIGIMRLLNTLEVCECFFSKILNGRQDIQNIYWYSNGRIYLFFIVLLLHNNSNYLSAIHSERGVIISQLPLCMTLTVHSGKVIEIYLKASLAQGPSLHGKNYITKSPTYPENINL